MAQPLIKTVEKFSTAPLSVRIDERVVAELDKYAEYKNVSKADIVAISIRAAIEMDKDYLQARPNAFADKATAKRSKKTDKTLVSAV